MPDNKPTTKKDAVILSAATNPNAAENVAAIKKVAKPEEAKQVLGNAARKIEAKADEIAVKNHAEKTAKQDIKATHGAPRPGGR